MFSAHTCSHAWEIVQYLHVQQSDMDHAGTSRQCSLSLSPTPSLSPSPGPVSNKSGRTNVGWLRRLGSKEKLLPLISTNFYTGLSHNIMRPLCDPSVRVISLLISLLHAEGQISVLYNTHYGRPHNCPRYGHARIPQYSNCPPISMESRGIP